MKIKRARNQIDKIQIERHDIRGAAKLKKEAHKHFKNLLTANGERANYESFLQHVPKKISSVQNSEIMQEIKEEEIEVAVWGFHLDKAPGMDGFTIAFYRQFWNIIKKDLVRMIRNVFIKKNWEALLNPPIRL